MAELLKKEYDLLALKIGMDLSEEDPQVSCELQGRSEGQLGLVQEWLCSAEEIGLPEKLNRRESTYQGYRFRFPEYLLNDLKNLIEESEYKDRPLWLHLAKPQGYLSLVPWEQLLVAALGRPVLRLPDFLAKPPRESLNSFDVILCSSLPVAKESFMAVDHLGQIVEHILALGLSNTTIHVFTDHQIRTDVLNRVDALPNVRVYDPAEAGELPAVTATTRVPDRPGQLANPWLVWMQDSLKGRSVDVAHFLAHGYISRDRGALAFAESPLENLDRRIARFVGATELMTFLTQIGAWSAAFSSPEHNYSEMGLRLLADTIAQSRPGPVLHHEMRMDHNCTAMAEAYAFLFGHEAVPPPVSPALFLYCHPSRLEQQPAAALELEQGVVRGIPKGVMPEPEPDIAMDALSSLYESGENVPAWIAATERYVEQRSLEADRMSREDEQPASRGREMRAKNAAVIQDTLRQIQETLANVAVKTKGEDGNG